MPEQAPEEIEAFEETQGVGAAWGAEENRAVVRVFDPDGALVVTNRFPDTARRPSITKYPAEKTGTYIVVLRSEGADADEGGTYKITVGVKVAKANRLFEGIAASGVVSFPASRGGTVSGTLSGNVIPPLLLVPQGELPAFLEITTRGTVHTLTPALLNGATGAWEIRFAQVGPVPYRLKIKPARRFPVLEEIDLAGP